MYQSRKYISKVFVSVYIKDINYKVKVLD